MVTAKRFSGIIRLVGALACATLIGFNYTPSMRWLRSQPDVLRLDGDAAYASGIPETVSRVLTESAAAETVASLSAERLENAAGGRIIYRLFGVIPVKAVEVVRAERVVLVPGGSAVGITIHTRGVLIVGLGAVDAREGALSPGSAAGLQAGDVLLTADGTEIADAAALSLLCRTSTDGLITLTFDRDGVAMRAEVRLVREAASGEYRIGLWVRDSTAGVGTLSFYDAATGCFAALGHAVSDVDTQSRLPIRDGSILETRIVDVKRGQQGAPGELVGVFSPADSPLGEIRINTDFGVFGRMHGVYENGVTGVLPLAFREEARVGPAKLLATIGDGGTEAFDCEIIRTNQQSAPATKGMIVSITDGRLLEKTGGIVQGMSGCPIVQDGKLIGIITHVFVNDPTRGYCIYAEWMYEQIALTASG